MNDVLAEAQAHGNMGITKMNLCLIEEAIANFEAQLECLEAKTKVNCLFIEILSAASKANICSLFKGLRKD